MSQNDFLFTNRIISANESNESRNQTAITNDKISIHKHIWFKSVSTLKDSTASTSDSDSVSRTMLLLFFFLLEARLQRTKYTRTKATTNYRNRVRAERISAAQTVMSDEPNESPEIKGVTMRANLKSLPLLFSPPHNWGGQGRIEFP